MASARRNDGRGSSVHLKDRCWAPARCGLHLVECQELKDLSALVSARTGQPVILLETVRLQSNGLLPKRYDYPIQSRSILRTFNLSNGFGIGALSTQATGKRKLMPKVNPWHDRCKRNPYCMNRRLVIKLLRLGKSHHPHLAAQQTGTRPPQSLLKKRYEH